MPNFEDRILHRQQCFKKASNNNEMRQRREDDTIHLRKREREEVLLNKRLKSEIVVCGANACTLSNPCSSVSFLTAEWLPTLADVFVTGITHADFETVFYATQQFRKLLSIQQSLPIAEVINAGLVPQFIQLLKEVNHPALQLEAAWIITNIASGTTEQTRIVVENGALPLFVNLMRAPNKDVREQAVWALGNIAGDCAAYRDLVLQSGGMNVLLDVMTSDSISLVRNAAWTLSSFCRGQPPPPLECVTSALSALLRLMSSADLEVLADACWAVSYVVEGSKEAISGVIRCGCCQRLVELLKYQSPLIQTPVLHACGSIVAGDDWHTQALLACGFLGRLPIMLAHQNRNIRQEACCILSHLAAGDCSYIQQLINAGLIPKVIHMLNNDDFRIKKQAAICISNATTLVERPQLEHLVQCGCATALISLLSLWEVSVVKIALNAIENMLLVGRQTQDEFGLDENPIAALIERADGVERLEKLHEHSNEDIFHRAMRMLDLYFPLSEDAVQNQTLQSDIQLPSKDFSFSQDAQQSPFEVLVPRKEFSFLLK